MMFMKKKEVKYKGEIMAQLSKKRWSHARPLAFKEINATLDEAKQDAPIRFINGEWKHISDLPVSYDVYRSAMLSWFEKWFGVP
jgi:hypothetical protein